MDVMVVVVCALAFQSSEPERVEVASSGSTTRLAAGDVNMSALPFASFSGSVGVEVHLTVDTDGRVPAEAAPLARSSELLVHLVANTGGKAMTSFEVRLYENSDVCRFVPEGSSAVAASLESEDDYTGKVSAVLNGEYTLELASRFKSPNPQYKCAAEPFCV